MQMLYFLFCNLPAVINCMVQLFDCPVTEPLRRTISNFNNSNSNLGLLLQIPQFFLSKQPPHRDSFEFLKVPVIAHIN